MNSKQVTLLLVVVVVVFALLQIASIIRPIPLDDGRASVPWYQAGGIMRYEDLEANVLCWVFVWGEHTAMSCIDARYTDY